MILQAITSGSPKRQWLRNCFTIAAVAALCMFAAACTQRPMPTALATTEAENGYYLGPGDKVRINVFGDEALSGEHQVSANGEIAMPLIGNVVATNVTPDQLREKIESRLAEYMRDPKVSVNTITYRPVYVVGEVKSPGRYEYEDGMTVINAIAVAGGYTYRAKKEAYIIDRKATGESVAATANSPLWPGDVITVRERYF